MSFHHIKSNQLFAESAFEALFQKCERPIVIADQLHTPENIGSLIRLADNVCARELIIIGNEGEFRSSKIRRAAASSYNNISWSFTNQAQLLEKIPPDYTLVALETASNATNIFTTSLPEKIALVVGNEVNGINASLLKMAKMCVYIPVPGPTRSLNVSHAAAVSLFEWMRQMMFHNKML